MGKRREGREAAIQLLYSRDLEGEEGLEEMETFWELCTARPGARKMATGLSRGVLANLEEIDQLLETSAENYDLRRLTPVDRNILRLAVYELMHLPDVPAPVAINEAIEIAKRFGGPESSRFVNGVLDRVKRQLPDRPANPPSERAEGSQKENQPPTPPAVRPPEKGASD